MYPKTYKEWNIICWWQVNVIFIEPNIVSNRSDSVHQTFIDILWHPFILYYCKCQIILYEYAFPRKKVYVRA